MTKVPIHFEGSVEVQGQVQDFQALLDPQTWHQNFPFLWPHSYLITNGAFGPNRDSLPPGAGSTVSTNPRGGLFFEQVNMGAISYRNVLEIEYSFHEAQPANVTFEYRQHECLTTELAGSADGGIDVDRGFATCVPAGRPKFVKITISKTVRFTEPRDLLELPFADETFEIMVKVGMDALLHSVLFF